MHGLSRTRHMRRTRLKGNLFKEGNKEKNRRSGESGGRVLVERRSQMGRRNK